MPDLATNMVEPVGGFQMQGMMMRYNLFMPRLYNWCLSLGFKPGKIMPSRAFCSDESQGYPIIIIAKHFGTFPFNHRRVGGIVATDRHGPMLNMAKTWSSFRPAMSATIRKPKTLAPTEDCKLPIRDAAPTAEKSITLAPGIRMNTILLNGIFYCTRIMGRNASSLIINFCARIAMKVCSYV